MTRNQAISTLDKARDLQCRSHNNYCNVIRASSHGKTAAAQLERSNRMSEQADALFDAVANWMIGQ